MPSGLSAAQPRPLTSSPSSEPCHENSTPGFRHGGGVAVRAMAEAITLIRALSGGGDPVTFDGEFYHWHPASCSAA